MTIHIPKELLCSPRLDDAVWHYYDELAQGMISKFEARFILGSDPPEEPSDEPIIVGDNGGDHEP